MNEQDSKTVAIEKARAWAKKNAIAVYIEETGRGGYVVRAAKSLDSLWKVDKHGHVTNVEVKLSKTEAKKCARALGIEQKF